MKIPLTLTIIMLTIVGLYFVYIETSLDRVEVMLLHCAEIQLGMTSEEVINELGEAEHIGIDTLYGYVFEDWKYDLPAGSSDPLAFYIDHKSQVVTDIYCIEDRKLGFDMKFLASIGYDSLKIIHGKLLSISNGMKTESLKILLGDSFVEKRFCDSIVWEYPQMWIGFQQPVITLDSDSMTVTNVDIGSESFVVR